MLECLILGDSIAVGTAQFRPECAVYAKVGINSRNWNNRYADKKLEAHSVIISLGSNDHEHIRTIQEVGKLRERITAGRVIWIVPANKIHVAEFVELVAMDYKDQVIYITQMSKDGVHPTTHGYKQLAEKTR